MDEEVPVGFVAGVVVRELEAVEGRELVRRELHRALIVKALDFGDLNHFPGVIRELVDLDHDLDCTGNHLLDGPGGHVKARLQDEAFQSQQGVVSRVGVEGAGAVVPGVKRSHQIQRFGAANLAHNNPARIHAQAGADQITEGHISVLRIQGPLGFQGDPELVMKRDFAGILHCHDDVRVPDEGAKAVQQRGLARAGAAGNECIFPEAYDGLEH